MTDDTTPPDPDTDELVEDEGPDTTELDDDPAYNPDDEALKDLKGG